MVDVAALGELGDDEHRQPGAEAAFAAGIAGTRVLAAAEVRLAVDEGGEVAAQVLRSDVVPPAAGLVEGDEESGVLPVAARLESVDEVTDEGVVRLRSGVAGMPVIDRGRLNPGDVRQLGNGRGAGNRAAGERVVEDAEVALVLVGLAVVKPGVEGVLVREVGGRGEVLEGVVVGAVAVRHDRGAGDAGAEAALEPAPADPRR